MWRRRLVGGFAAWAVTFALSVVAGTDPQPVLLAALMALVAGIAWLAVDLSEMVSPAEWDTWASSARRRGSDVRVGVLQRALEDIATRQEVERLHPMLVDLVDERLEAHHGVRREQEPVRAAALMGDELTQFVEHPPPPVRFGNLMYLGRIVGRIEEL